MPDELGLAGAWCARQENPPAQRQMVFDRPIPEQPESVEPGQEVRLERRRKNQVFLCHL
jgi:hypothetical protein